MSNKTLNEHAPWEIRISGVAGDYRAEVTRSRLSVRQEKDSWVGSAYLVGRITERNKRPYAEALTLLSTVLLNRADGFDDDHWYVDTGEVIIRIEPTEVEATLGKKGVFHLQTSLDLTVMMSPGGISEQELVSEVMDYVFSSVTTEVYEDEEEEDIRVR